MKTGGWLRLALQLTAEQETAVNQLGLDITDLNDETHRLHVLQLAEPRAGELFDKEIWNRIADRAARLKLQVRPPVPESFQLTLRPYQVEGFHFLAYLASNNFGGILADDMGLGKTAQAICWLLWLRERSAAAGEPDVKEKLHAQYMEPVGGSPQDLATFMQQELKVMTPVIKRTGIKVGAVLYAAPPAAARVPDYTPGQWTEIDAGQLPTFYGSRLPAIREAAQHQHVPALEAAKQRLLRRRRPGRYAVGMPPPPAQMTTAPRSRSHTIWRCFIPIQANGHCGRSWPAGWFCSRSPAWPCGTGTVGRTC
mgnify:CR=1 FL=1